jgi:Cu2+-containing amine oxidase
MRFAPDGTIRPRYGFGSTKNACVCSAHQHNAYWRFDFDIVNPTNKIFQIERGRKFLKPITNEASILRNYGTNRGFVIQNSTGNEAYSLTPSLADGNADTFSRGDFWFLKYKGTTAAPDELDDQNVGAIANFAPWLDNESLVDQDVVVWYAGHFVHNDDANLLDPDRSGMVLTGSHVVGPTLRPIRW